MTLLMTLAGCALVMAASFSGKMLTWRGLGPVIERNMHFFVSFAAGVLLVVVYNLSSEIVEHAGTLSAGVPWIALGAVVVLVAFKYIPHFHHHHEKGAHDHSHIDANRILASDAVHNIGDGAVLAVSYAASPVVGLATTLSIVVHEMLQEISEFFVLREAGMPVARALLLNFATSATILFGAIGAYFALERFEVLEVPLLGLAAGSYLIVIFHDLIPHSLESAYDRRHWSLHAAYFLAGVILMALIVMLLPHAEVGH